MAGEIAALDQALAAGGSNIMLRRQTGSAPSFVNHDLTVRARVNSGDAKIVVDDVEQIASTIIMSPTEIAVAGWPGTGEMPSVTVADPSLPRKGDQYVIAGRVRGIEVVDPIYMSGQLVRIEAKVLG